MPAALSVEQIFDSLAIRINGPEAWDHRAILDWHFTDPDEQYRTSLRNGVLVPTRMDPAEAAVGFEGAPGFEGTPADVTFTLTRSQLLDLLAGKGSTPSSTPGTSTRSGPWSRSWTPPIRTSPS